MSLVLEAMEPSPEPVVEPVAEELEPAPEAVVMAKAAVEAEKLVANAEEGVPPEQDGLAFGISLMEVYYSPEKLHSAPTTGR